MKNSKCSIEEVNMDYHKDGDELFIRGWAYANYREYESILFYRNGNPIESVEIEKVHRDDVNSYYRKINNNDSVGFRVTATIIKPQKDDFFEIIGIQQNEKVLVWRSSIEEFKKESKLVDILYGVDSVKAIDGKIKINGWAVSVRGSGIQIQLKNQNNKNILFKKKDLTRIDASITVFGNEDGKECGFLLETENIDFNDHLTLTIISDFQIKDIPIEIDTFAIEPKLKETTLSSSESSSKRSSNFVKNMKMLFQSKKNAQTENTHPQNEYSYDTWYRNNSPDEEKLEKQRKEESDFMPKISMILASPKSYLKETIQSLLQQTYKNWEVCILAENTEQVKKIVDQFQNERITYHTASTIQNALNFMTGDLICYIDHDVILAPNAFYEIAKRFYEDEMIDIVYSDEDQISMKHNIYYDPQFKSDFNIDLLRSTNYIGHFFTCKRKIFEETGELRCDQSYDLILRSVEKTNHISHIPEVLYHNCFVEKETVDSEEDIKAIQAHLHRIGEEADVEAMKQPGCYKTTYVVKGDPLVSVIIPNKDNVDSLKKCILSIVERSTYTNYEIIIVENNSCEKETFEFYQFIQKINNRIKVVNWNGTGFNYSSINNFGVKYAKGEYLLLLNNDIEVITSDWIERMIGICQRKDVGIVGAKLLYPDHTIQHCGVIIGLGGVAGHMFTDAAEEDPGYFSRAILQQDLSAVTAACLMVKREVYEEADGLEEKLKVAFNDIDFCLKVREKGYLIVLDPNVNLFHYESKSRGKEDSLEKFERFSGEVAFMKNKWGSVIDKGDPYYNCHLSLENDTVFRMMEKK